MAFFQYQSFDDAPGMVDSKAKLRAMKLPPLKGKSFFDVACNEGYYCGVALRAGATRVVGLDGSLDFINAGRIRFPEVEFLHQSWDVLPDELFDVVLFASAMHYLRTSDAVLAMLNRLRERLSSKGTLILEVGIAPGEGGDLVEYRRKDSSVFYPQVRLLLSLIKQSGLLERFVGYSEPGDGVVRHVYHCNKMKPTILIMRGDFNSGKTRSSWAIAGYDFRRWVSVDSVMHSTLRRRYPDVEFDERTTNGIDTLVSREPEQALELIVASIMNEVELVNFGMKQTTTPKSSIIIDGFGYSELHQKLFEVLCQRLEDNFFIWESSAKSKVEKNWWDYSSTPYVKLDGYLVEQCNPKVAGTVVSTKIDGENIIFELQISPPTGSHPEDLTLYIGGKPTKPFTIYEDHSSLLAKVPISTFAPPNSDAKGLLIFLSELNVRVAVYFSTRTADYLPRPDDTLWLFRK